MRNYIAAFVLIGTLLLAGCNFGSSTESQLSKVLSEMNSAEGKSRDAQSDLNDLEKTEQALFNKTMELTQEQIEELEMQVLELEKLLEERLVLLNEEEASIKKAKESVASFDSILEKAETGKKKQIEKLKQAVNKRYELHATFTAEYKKLMDLQKELYKMLLDEETELQAFQSKVNDVNEQNGNVQAAIDLFNEATNTINSLKIKVTVNTNKE